MRVGDIALLVMFTFVAWLAGYITGRRRGK